MDGKGCDCSGTLTRRNTTVNLETLINSQNEPKYRDQHGTTRQPNRRIQIGSRDMGGRGEAFRRLNSLYQSAFLRCKYPKVSLCSEVFK